MLMGAFSCNRKDCSDRRDDEKWYQDDITFIYKMEYFLFFVYDNSTGIVPVGTIPFYRELFVCVDLGTDSTTSSNPTRKY